MRPSSFYFSFLAACALALILISLQALIQLGWDQERRVRLSRMVEDLMPLSYGDKIRQIHGVTSLTPRLWGYYYDPAGTKSCEPMIRSSTGGAG